MYKTIWIVTCDGVETKLTTYHFGKTPKFPTWYMEENTIYTIKILWNVKVINTLNIFFKCLTHSYIIQ